MPSLRHKLAQALGTPSLVLTVAAGGLAYGVSSSVVSTSYDQNLLNLAHATSLHVLADGGVLSHSLTPAAELVLRSDTVDSIFFRISDPAGKVMAGDADLPWPEEPSQPTDPYGALQAGAYPRTVTPRPQGSTFFNATYQGLRVRAVRIYREREKHGYYVTVAETLEKRRGAMEHLLLGFVCAAVLIAAAAELAVHFGIPSALAPLKKLETALAARSGADLSPIAPDSVPLEIRELVRALNALFERLRKASEHQRQFLQDAAHQLRTPLASLQMQVELLEADPNDTTALKRLKQSIARSTRLANQLLALARAEAGSGMMGTPQRVELAGIIDGMVEDWLAQADAKAIDFGIDREPATVEGDPVLLRELLANVVDNALRYTPDGGEVSLRCRPAGEVVEIEVSDSGPGIPPAEREAVFERFYRLPDTTLPGTGLGLPIAREIVAGHHGTITLDTAENGHGTLVHIVLPNAGGHLP
ncbi:sensor histidine kinase [Pseudothauera rhizosphaerae]|uniref:histidine kinase n=1 Tax=Pseudothauera rhizosphaerae TaxID=2565932 RepID=A0A4S4AM69_9RHOO|nr:sensor histidine kinase [Pseudothauera rhizosphaerae]THF60643.1 sensor histidine kinase [Pseudothauera rhizosphaerae]